MFEVSASEYGDRREGKLRAQFGIWCAEDPVVRMEAYKESVRAAQAAGLDVKQIPSINFIVPAGPEVLGEESDDTSRPITLFCARHTQGHSIPEHDPTR